MKGERNHRRSLADFMRELKVDDFTVSGNLISIGGQSWIASRCGCGLLDCDVWELKPIDAPMPPAAEGTQRAPKTNH